jgi:hypothetical protein
MSTSSRARIGVVAGAVAAAAVVGTGTMFAGGAAESPAPPPAAPAVRTDVVPYSYIVVLRDTVAQESVAATANDLVNHHGGAVNHTYTLALAGFSVLATDQQVQEMAKDPRVEFVEPNKRIGIPE